MNNNLEFEPYEDNKIPLTWEESKARTAALQEEYNCIVKEEKKKSYRVNNIEPEYKMNWEGYAHDLERELLCLAYENTSGEIEKAILTARKYNSISQSVDNKKVYTCPLCGKSNTLDIGTRGSYICDNINYSVFCNSCDFECPYPCDDCGEAWEMFRKWLKDNNYI